ncbi:MAG: cell envelope integrity protein TolA [Sphingomonadaceae bacterium]
MIDAAERKGLGIAVLGHLGLFAVLSLSLMFRNPPQHLPREPMDVSLVGPIGLKPATPEPNLDPPAESQAPEEGPTAETPPPPPPKPEPVAKAEPEPKPAPKPSAVKAPAKPAPGKKQKLDDDLLKDIKQQTAKEKKATGARLGPDFLKGITSESTGGKSQKPRAAISGLQMRGLAAAIASQVKPCYVIPTGGTDATRIVSVMRLRFNPDGSIDGTPSVTDHEGVTATNQGYVRQMDDAAIRAVLRCSPLRLPPELYEGGWEDIEFAFYPQAMR